MKKVAILGFGYTAEKGHLPTYRSRADIELTAVVDPITSRRAAALRQYPNIRVYENTQDLFQEYNKEFDIIDVCLANAMHFEAIKQALNADKHVICERPLVLNKNQYNEVVQLAQNKKRVIYPCHNYKFAPSIAHAAYLIGSGEIGKPVFASFNIFGAGYSRGVPQWQPDWRKDKNMSGGGLMIDQGLDAISAAQTLLGGIPQRISAQMKFLGDTSQQMEDLAVLCADWGSTLVNITISSLGSMQKSSYRIQGTEGEIYIENNDVILNNKTQGIQHTFVPTYFDDSFHSNWFNGLIDDLMNCIDNNIQPFSLTEAGLVLDLIEKVQQSNSSGGAWMPIDYQVKPLAFAG
ncbi:MAG: Gfo/Idh/MocA family protein [Microcoleaceae cyanobacterium]